MRAGARRTSRRSFEGYPLTDVATWRLLAGLCDTRRSVRRYESQRVSRATVRALIDTAVMAPSNYNSQPWRFVVADRVATRRRIISAVDAALERAQETKQPAELSSVVGHIAAWLHPLREAPVIVLAFYQRNPRFVASALESVSGAGDIRDYNPNLLSLGMALEHLLLGAHAFGLGACAMSGPVPLLRPEINAMLGLPRSLELANVVAIGVPAEEPRSPGRRDLDRSLTFL